MLNDDLEREFAVLRLHAFAWRLWKKSDSIYKYIEIIYFYYKFSENMQNPIQELIV